MLPRALVAASLLTALVGSAAADPQKTANEAKAAARYRQGRAYFQEGLYSHALEEFGAAYALVPRPLLLYHMGTVHEKLGDKRTALDLYRRMVAADPDGEGALAARARISVLERELAGLPPPASQPAPPPAWVAPPPEAPPQAGAPMRAPSTASWLWWGGGVAAIGGGLALDLVPDSADDYQLELIDFVPLACYAVGAAAVTMGVIEW